MGLLDGKLGGALGLIGSFGGAVTLRWFEEGEYDTSTGRNDVQETQGSPVSTKAIREAVQSIAAKDLVGLEVHPGDERWTVQNISSFPRAPEAGMTAEVAVGGGKVLSLTVIDVNPVFTGDEVGLYQLLVGQR